MTDKTDIVVSIKENGLEEVTADNAPAIYGHNKLSVFLDAVRDQVTGEVPDITSKKGRERIASLAAKVSRSKTAIEKPGRDYLRRIKELPKSIEAELREFVGSMDALRDEVRAPLTEYEAAEAARVEKHELGIEILKQSAEMMEDFTSGTLLEKIASLEAVVIDSSWEEFEATAHRVKASSLATIKSALDKRQKYEAEQAELERHRQEEAKRQQQEREAAIAREAAERAKQDAERHAQAKREAAAKREADAIAAAEKSKRDAELSEQRRIAAEKQAEIDRLASIERERVAAEQAEKRRLQAIEDSRQAEIKRHADEQARIEAEAKAREADKAHKGKVNRAALDALVAGGLTEECAKQAITLIIKGQVPSVRISY